MPTLTDPILHDCARIIQRHPDLSPEYKTRLLEGLARVDVSLAEKQAQMAPEAAPPTAKGAKR